MMLCIIYIYVCVCVTSTSHFLNLAGYALRLASSVLGGTTACRSDLAACTLTPLRGTDTPTFHSKGPQWAYL